MKQAYVSKGYGVVNVSLVETTHPYILTSIETEIPNLPLFSVKIPIEDSGLDYTRVAILSVEVLLEQFVGHLVGVGCSSELCEQIYTNVLSILENFDLSSKSPDNAERSGSSSPIMDDILNKDPIKNFEFKFKLPEDFYREIYKRIIVASGYVRTERVAPFKREFSVKFEDLIPSEINPSKLLKKYRNNVFKHTPSKNYIMVYDISGRPTGVMEAPRNPIKWKSR